MLPDPSVPTPIGESRLLALMPPSFAMLEVKLAPCPRTPLAGPPTHGKVLPHAVNGVVNSSTRLLPLSAANRFPKPSTAIPAGAHRLRAVTAMPLAPSQK